MAFYCLEVCVPSFIDDGTFVVAAAAASCCFVFSFPLLLLLLLLLHTSATTRTAKHSQHSHCHEILDFSFLPIPIHNCIPTRGALEKQHCEVIYIAGKLNKRHSKSFFVFRLIYSAHCSLLLLACMRGINTTE
jgi:hypothetical protein